MATKKQKRAAGLAKREAYMIKVKEDGLKALEADRQRQKERRAAAKAAAEEINLRHEEILAKAKANLKPRPKKQTSFYSEIQGRPVNAETYYAEKKQEKEVSNLGEWPDAAEWADLDEWAKTYHAGQTELERSRMTKA